MTLFRVTPDKLEPAAQTTFAAENLLERRDLQRLLRCDISPVGADLMVIAEEFGDWEDCGRRIDLLCLSKDASLVVVEIKRTEDGGHMELQAIRYAAMVSSMTLDQAIGAYARFKGTDQDAAKRAISSFLDSDPDDDAELSGEVRIVLVSADFSAEVTTAVLWLNKRGLDIACVRLRPYRIGGDVVLDVTQIIPLPEAAEYEIKVRAQEREKQRAVGARQETIRRFWAQLIERSKARTQLLAGRTAPTEHGLTAGIGRVGFTLQLATAKDWSSAACTIRIQDDAEKSKSAFDQLQTHRTSVEAAFGGPLAWESVDGRQTCRIWTKLEGGWKSSESDWPILQDRMIDVLIRLDAALRKYIQRLVV